MATDIYPLFTIEKEGKTLYAYPEVKKDGKHINIEKLVDKLADEIAPYSEAVLSNKQIGEMTLAATIVLETLHRLGEGRLADDMLSSPSLLFQLSMFCSMGIEIGRTITREIEIDTEFYESGPNIWEAAGRDKPRNN